MATAEAPPLGNFASHFDSEPLLVKVTSPNSSSATGPSQIYFLHKRLLIAKSPYFATLLNSPLKGTEVTSSTVHLSDVSIGAFDALVDYLYHTTYACAPKERYPTRDHLCVLHAEVYVLAERMCMNGLKDLAVGKMEVELKEASLSKRASVGRQLDKRLKATTVLRLLELVYSGTLDRRISADGDNMGRTETVRGSPTGATVDGGQVARLVEGHVVSDELLNKGRTVDAHQSSEVKPVERPRDSMRTLIVTYVASIMSRMKSHPAFITYLRDDTEFLEDLITVIPDRETPYSRSDF